MNLSIVIALFNEEESLPELTDWIVRVVEKEKYTYEIIFIDDGSTDNSLEVIRNLRKTNKQIKNVSFQRNYGKSAALHIGFQKAEGEVVITMDADMQDSPDEIPKLYKKIKEENYDVVSGWKKKRYDPISKTIPSKLFNRSVRMFSGIKLHDFNCGLKSYRKKVVKSIEVYGEMHRYIPFIAKQAGFTRITEVVVEHRARKYGKTKFGISRFMNGFLDLMSIIFITKFAKKPMHLFGLIGSFMFFISIIMLMIIGGIKLYNLNIGIPARLITESPLFYIFLTTALLGTQFFLAGFIAELVSRTSNDRNKYNIKTNE